MSALTDRPKSSQIYAWIIHLLRTNADIRTFCEETYGRYNMTFSGADLQEAPKETDCPYVIVLKQAHMGGLSVKEEMHSFALVLAVSEPQVFVEPSEADVGELQGLKGVDDIEALCYLVVKALDGLPSACRLDEFVIVHNDVTSMPFFEARIDLTITVPATFGACVTIPTPP